MAHDRYTDDGIASVLGNVRTIAVVGASDDPSRPSFSVSQRLAARGYRVFPVNPRLAGGEILGRSVHASLADVPEPVDMVDVFRASSAAGGVVDEALALDPLPRVIWMQIGVRDEAAAARAEAAGLAVVMDRCPEIELGRLSGGGAGLPRRAVKP